MKRTQQLQLIFAFWLVLMPLFSAGSAFTSASCPTTVSAITEGLIARQRVQDSTTHACCQAGKPASCCVPSQSASSQAHACHAEKTSNGISTELIACQCVYTPQAPADTAVVEKHRTTLTAALPTSTQELLPAFTLTAAYDEPSYRVWRAVPPSTSSPRAPPFQG